MEQDQSGRANYLRYAHEFLFSLNLALASNLTGEPRLFWGFFHLSVIGFKLKFAIEQYIYHYKYPNSQFAPKDIEGNAAFLIFTFCLALCIFLFFRFLAETAVAKHLLYSVAGFTSILSLPILTLYLNDWNRRPPDLASARPFLLALELIVAVTGILLFLLGKWRPGWSGPLLLILHCVYWGWLFLGGPYFWLAPFQSLFPATALCASLVWGLYVSTSGASEFAAGPAFN
jgi:hypothetical protein